MNLVRVIQIDDDTFLEGINLERELQHVFRHIYNVSYLGKTKIKLDRHQYYECHRFLVVGNND